MREDMVDRLFGELAASELPVPTSASVIARGRQRRRRARVLAVAAPAALTALAVIVVAAIGELPGSHPAAQSAADHRGSEPTVCTAAPTAALIIDIRRRLALSSQRAVAPIAVSPDGTAVYVQTATRGSPVITEESLATGAIIASIAALPPHYEGAQGGLGLGGELIWTSMYSTHGGESYAYTPMLAWSPRSGRTVALEPAGQHGDAMGAPVFLNQAIAAWEQADGSQQEIVEANLATGSTDVIARGYLGPPVFVGRVLVWPVASHAEGPASHLAARNAGVFPARQPVAVPVQLRAAGHASLMGSSSQGTWSTPVGLIASSGPATAYISPDLTELFYSPSPAQPARLVLKLRGGNTFVPALAIGDGYLGWTVNGDGSYLASTTSLAAARITQFGTVTGLSADYVIVGGSPTSKLSGLRQFQLFNAATVQALRCARPVSH
jgi:hypothetical protein